MRELHGEQNGINRNVHCVHSELISETLSHPIFHQPLFRRPFALQLQRYADVKQNSSPSQPTLNLSLPDPPKLGSWWTESLRLDGINSILLQPLSSLHGRLLSFLDLLTSGFALVVIIVCQDTRNLNNADETEEEIDCCETIVMIVLVCISRQSFWNISETGSWRGVGREMERTACSWV